MRFGKARRELGQPRSGHDQTSAQIRPDPPRSAQIRRDCPRLSEICPRSTEIDRGRDEMINFGSFSQVPPPALCPSLVEAAAAATRAMSEIWSRVAEITAPAAPARAHSKPSASGPRVAAAHSTRALGSTAAAVPLHAGRPPLCCYLVRALCVYTERTVAVSYTHLTLPTIYSV